MKQYDDYTIREALHNAIAHQDYTLQQRINLWKIQDICIMKTEVASFPVLCKKHWQPKDHSVISEMNVFAGQW